MTKSVYELTEKEIDKQLGELRERYESLSKQKTLQLQLLGQIDTSRSDILLDIAILETVRSIPKK